MTVEIRESELAGEARSFIGSAQKQSSARGNCRHAHSAKGAHLAPLTQLTGAAYERGYNAAYAAHCKRAAHMNAPRNRGRLKKHKV